MDRGEFFETESEIISVKIPDEDLAEWVAELFWLDFTVEEADIVLRSASDKYKVMSAKERYALASDTLGKMIKAVMGLEYEISEDEIVEIAARLKCVRREVKNLLKKPEPISKISPPAI